MKDVAKETHFLVLVKEPKKGSWQKHSRFKFLLAAETTFHHTNQMQCGSKMRKRRPSSPMLIPPNSCLSFFLLYSSRAYSPRHWLSFPQSLYSSRAYSPCHWLSFPRHCISYKYQFYLYCRFYIVRFLAILPLITHLLFHLTLFPPHQPAFSLLFPTPILCLFASTEGAKLV